MVYDVMRGLDYLETRPEVDMSRVAMTGASGGGTMTGYVSALDDRVAAAAPVSALGSSRGGGGNYDAEQVLYGGFPWALDCEGFLSLIAPRPAIVICEVANDDAKRQNLASYDVARKIYNLKQAGDKLEYVPTPGPHGYGAVHFNPFKEWLARTLPPNPGTPPYSKKKSKIPMDNFNASKAGNVFYSRELAGSETVHALNTRAVDLALSFDRGVTNAATATERSAEIARKLRELLVLDAGEVAGPKATRRGSETFDGVAIEKWVLESEPGIFVPAVFLKTKREGKAPAVIWLAQHGKRSILKARWPILRGLLDAGVSVLLPDLRATGETCVDTDDTFLGGEAELVGYSFKAARPLIGMRVHDTLSCAAWLRTRDDVDAARIALAGDSLSGFNAAQIRQPRLVTDAGLEPIEQAQSLGPAVALLAFALDNKLSCCATRGALASYAMVCPQLYFMHPWSTFVPGVLKVCDVADICAAAAPRPLLLTASVNAWNQRLDKGGEAAAGFPRLAKAYEWALAPSAVLIDGAGDAEEVGTFLKGSLLKDK
jgi:dienelactone hydrolase